MNNSLTVLIAIHKNAQNVNKVSDNNIIQENVLHQHKIVHKVVLYAHQMNVLLVKPDTLLTHGLSVPAVHTCTPGTHKENVQPFKAIVQLIQTANNV